MLKNILTFQIKKKTQYDFTIKLLTKTGLEKIKKEHEREDSLSDIKRHETFGYSIYINKSEKPIYVYISREEKIKYNPTKSTYYTILYAYDKRKENTKPEKISNLSVRDPNLDWKENEKRIEHWIRSEIYGMKFMVT